MAKPINDLTAEYVKSILDYNSETGKLYWKPRKDVKKPLSWLRQFAGKEAGKIDNDIGYIRIGINGRLYLAHRIIWLINTGRWPDPEADHKDLNGINNKWNNLREATRSQNTTNRRTKRISGFRGVCWHKKVKKWAAQINKGKGNSQHIGYYSTPEEAHDAYCVEAKKRHGEFAKFD